MIETILSTILLAQSVGPGYDQGSTNRYAPSPLITCTNDKGLNAYVNLRTGPSQYNSVIAKLRPNHGIEGMTARKVAKDNYLWAKVVTADGKEGWIRDDYVCVNQL